MKTFGIAVRMSVLTLLVTGVAYPLVVLALGRALSPAAAAGSFVSDDNGAVVGSELIGQRFSQPAYFQPRPSAAGSGFDASASGGSNLAPTSRKLKARIAADAARLHAENPDATAPVPLELVSASASGLDPHVSPEAARWQVPRVAKARGVAPERVRRIVDSNVEGRDLGFLGEPRVNVLLVNLALDRQLGRPQL